MWTELSEFTFRFAAGDRDFSFLDKIKTTQTHIQCLLLCFYFTFPGLKQMGHGVYQSPPSSDIRSESSCTPNMSQLHVAPKKKT